MAVIKKRIRDAERKARFQATLNGPAFRFALFAPGLVGLLFTVWGLIGIIEHA